MEHVTNIQKWLEQHGLAKHAAVFASHEITLEVLPHLTESDIDRLALPTGPRRRLLVAIEALGAASRAQRSVQSAETLAEQLGISYDVQRRQLTVMFCDLVGSTALAERLDPEELRKLMQAYRTVGSEVVTRYEGWVAQFRGDGLVVYFGWPSAHEDDAERCVRSALEIVHAVKSVSTEPPLAVRIGVATGTVVVGKASPADDAEARLAVGETPNLAARLQGLAEPDEVVISTITRLLVRGAFDLGDLGVHSLKGIAQPVQAWRVHALHRPEGRFEAAQGGVALTPLVGRQEEVALLLRCWRKACDGEGQVVLLTGEPGIGKSRLTLVLREQIAAEPHTVLRYQCSPYHRNSALYPITEQLELAAGFTREDTPEQKLDKVEGMLAGSPVQRAEAAPLVAALLSLPAEHYPPLNLSSQKQKEKTLEVLAAQLEARARHQPVLMIFEDVHWIDPTSHEVLDALIPRLRTLPIMLVITYRPEYTPNFAEHSHVTVLSVGRLERHEGAHLVARVARGRLPTEVLEQIVARTDGVPLFVEELTKSVLESGLLHEEGDRYTLHRPLPALVIPTSLRDSLAARLDRLAPVKEVIQIGACIGREFSYSLLARISPLRDDELDEALRKLIEAGLVRGNGTPPEATYTFKHALVQDAAYDSLLHSQKQLLHAQLAHVLEEDFAERVANEPELLAHHYTRAENSDAAIPLWREAGELAARRAALREAVGHFQAGLALIDKRPSSPQRDDLELSIREPLMGAWIGLRGWPASEVEANARAILKLAENRGTPESLLMGLYGTWISTLTQGRVAQALEWADRLLAEGDKAGDVDLQMLGHTASTISHFYLGQLHAARDYGDRGIALYDPQRADRWVQLTGHDARTVFLGWSAHWTWMLGYPDQAVQMSNEQDAHARRLGHALNLGYALTVGAYPFDYRREPEPLFECVREADHLAREQNIPILYQVMVPQVEGLARLRRGELPKAISLLRQGIDNWIKLGGHTRVPYLRSALAEALALQGDLDAAVGMIGRSLEQIETPGWQERSHLAEVLRLKGWILMRQGNHEEAETVLRTSIDWARQQHAKSWELRSSTTLAQLLLERGERDAARELLAPIYDWFTEGFDTRDLTAARALLESLR
jgi:class 3 adenylate cyclase/tetratricopeptide (TPR) repeat protein